MPSDRDTLADLIYRVGCYDNEDAATAAADRLIAAGVRPPARVIETAEDLDALPAGAVVAHTPCPDDRGCVWQSGTGGFWFVPGDGCVYDPQDLISHRGVGGQLLAVWEPEQEARP